MGCPGGMSRIWYSPIILLKSDKFIIAAISVKRSIFGGCCNCYFWDVRLKIERIPNVCSFSWVSSPYKSLFILIFLNFVRSLLYAFQVSNCLALILLKGVLSPVMLLKEKHFTTDWKFRNLEGFVWKTIQAWLCGKSCFSLTNPSNLRQLLQSLLLRYTAENEDTLCMLFQLC